MRVKEERDPKELGEFENTESHVLDLPGKDLRPRIISCLLFCREIRSSDIIKPNITREMNWLV